MRRGDDGLCRIYSKLRQIGPVLSGVRPGTGQALSRVNLHEFTVLAAGDDKEKLGEAEEILIKLAGQGYDNDIAWLRCKGRLLKAKGEFAAAAVAWGRVRAASKSALQVQSRQWWRAKFYEIQCWGKLPGTSETDVAHAVEVLESSFSDIPRFWAVKLEGLKDGADR